MSRIFSLHRQRNNDLSTSQVNERSFVATVSLMIILVFSLIDSSRGSAFQSTDLEKSKFEEQWAQLIQSKIHKDLSRYCPDGCALLEVEVESREVFDTSRANLGFDSVDATPRRFEAQRAEIEILVDNRIGETNIERLNDVLDKASRSYGIPIDLELTRTTFPDSPQVVRSEAEAKSLALGRVRAEIEQIISGFCPDDCRLSSVQVSTSRIAVEESQSQASHRIVVVPDSKWALLIQGSSVNLSLDERMSAARRSQIESVLRDTLSSFGSANLIVKSVQLPRSARLIEKDDNDLRADPWGIDKLGRALKVFREFANTKEIIKEREISSREAMLEKSSATKERVDQARETSTSLESQSESLTKQDSDSVDFWTQERVFLLGGVLCVVLIVLALGLRFVLTGKQVQHLISEGRGLHARDSNSFDELDEKFPIDTPTAASPVAFVDQSSGHMVRSSQPFPVATMVSQSHGADVATRLNIQSIRDELTQYFIGQQKISREVFSRILREDGVEFAAKCVSVLGEVVVFDLAADHELKKEVALLAEYIHVSPPFVDDVEQLEVLRSLKLKLTAGKIRQLTQRTQDSFDFLRPHSARVIFDLIADESARSQAVVLTQLSTEKRRSVFELFHGQGKSDLLRALGVNESLSRDYIQNVADVLKRKLQTTNLADSGVLGGADVIIDLMEQSDRNTQAIMLSELDAHDIELARQVRSRLVSIETLGYLSDGLLLEVFLSMEPQQMVLFLAGVREHIRNMILQKAPDDIASDWNASAASLKGIDPENFRLAEMQVLGKMRTFVSSGMLNLNDINDIMYPRLEGTAAAHAEELRPTRFKISSPVVA
ncbi:MAG: Flagellar motor switch protein FliG [Pseudomonadota bacterium]